LRSRNNREQLEDHSDAETIRDAISYGRQKTSHPDCQIPFGGFPQMKDLEDPGELAANHNHDNYGHNCLNQQLNLQLTQIQLTVGSVENSEADVNVTIRIIRPEKRDAT
jgi:hypothetical protein